MIVLDSSAILAFLQGEPGSDHVEQALVEGAVCGAANWSEVGQKVIAVEHAWDLSVTLMATYGLAVEPVTRTDGDQAAQLWVAGEALSLGDRLCLALAIRLRTPVLTADRRWSEIDTRSRYPDIEVRQIR